ncbi:conserved hypothetical protein [Burkholderia pseudomallei Pakistan 9]|nr:conserved hypothetical protein [Burkholderia pseudomallei Pakistan 9]
MRARAARPRARRLRATRAVAARRALALRPSPFALHCSPLAARHSPRAARRAPRDQMIVRHKRGRAAARTHEHTNTRTRDRTPTRTPDHAIAQSRNHTTAPDPPFRRGVPSMRSFDESRFHAPADERRPRVGPNRAARSRAPRATIGVAPGPAHDRLTKSGRRHPLAS